MGPIGRIIFRISGVTNNPGYQFPNICYNKTIIAYYVLTT